jgi:hypothetical protein
MDQQEKMQKKLKHKHEKQSQLKRQTASAGFTGFRVRGR